MDCNAIGHMDYTNTFDLCVTNTCVNGLCIYWISCYMNLNKLSVG